MSDEIRIYTLAQYKAILRGEVVEGVIARTLGKNKTKKGVPVEIQLAIAEAEGLYKEIAERFGVSRSTVSNIKRASYKYI